MTTQIIPRLCGGTFFTLFLRARKPLQGANKYYAGIPEPFSQPIALFALAKVIAPDWQNIFIYAKTTVRGNTTEYKTCTNDGGSIYPFDDDAALSAFDERVKTEYPMALSEMCDVSALLVDSGSTKKDVRLVRELLALIKSDDSILDDQLFYVEENGEAVTKVDLLQEERICLQSFLLGLWHFAVTRTEKNAFGKSTIDEWCPSSGGGKREYKGNLQELIATPIILTYHTPNDEPEKEEPIEDEDTVDAEMMDDDTAGETSEKASAGTTQQIVNNNPAFFTFNVTGNGNSFINKVDTVIIKNGGKKDE